MTDQQNDKTKFWITLVAIMLGVSVAVLLIDMTIKAAILEESNALRRVIIGVRDDGSAEANPVGSANQHSGNSTLLDFVPAGMETGNVANGNKAEAKAQPRKRKPTQPRTQGDTGEIPEGD